MQITKGAQVKLKTFLGIMVAQKQINDCDNYWKLIGKKGKVIDDGIYNGRILVLFEENLDNFGLANHNPIINSLWIKESDLELDNM